MSDDDLALFLLMHKCIRQSLRSFADSAPRLTPADAARIRAMVQWFAFVEHSVHGHHSGEDELLYPMLAAKDPTITADTKVLEADHKQLDPMMSEARAGLEALATATGEAFASQREKVSAVLTKLEELMASHLDREEAAVIPRLKRDVTRDELKRLERDMAKGATLKEMSLVLPWVLSAANDHERRLVGEVLPWPVKLLYRWSWKKRFEALTNPLA